MGKGYRRTAAGWAGDTKSILIKPRPVPTLAGLFCALQGHAFGFEER